MSLLKKLFGGEKNSQDATPASPAVAAETEHNGFKIRATPFKAEGQFQTSGVISREIDGVVKEHSFIRADRFASPDEAASHALRKGIQIVDEQGEGLFR